jgi:hypothetical protein
MAPLRAALASPLDFIRRTRLSSDIETTRWETMQSFIHASADMPSLSVEQGDLA